MAYTTVDDPTIFFTTNLRSGLYGGSDTAFNIGFQPDWIWDKKRSGTGVHSLFDSVRGFGSSGKVLYSNNANAEATNALIDSVSSTGYTIKASSDDTGTMVDWCWKAGGSASSNSDGTITSSVSANTTAGFSIVSYTSNGSASQTVGHGLGAVPHMIIAKNRDSSGSSYNYWTVYHHSLATANDKKLKLNETEAATTTNLWGDADPTTTKFYVHTSGDGSTNVSTDKIIAYCFTGIKGYSKFGSYTGNGEGSGGGPFIYLGFKPAFFLLKETSGADNWTLMDTKRLGYNPRNDHLFPNLNNAEYATDRIDIVSNGIKIIDNDGSINQSGSTYIYMAFAENPFVNSNGIPNNAR